jgi:hypothetical protein
MDIEDFLMAVEDVLMTGDSGKRGSEMLATASRTILHLHMVPGVNLDPLILSLQQAKVRLSKRLAESDAATAAAATAPFVLWGRRSGSMRISGSLGGYRPCSDQVRDGAVVR